MKFFLMFHCTSRSAWKQVQRHFGRLFHEILLHPTHLAPDILLQDIPRVYQEFYLKAKCLFTNPATCPCFWCPVLSRLSPCKLPSILRHILVQLDVKDRLNIWFVSELPVCVSTVQSFALSIVPFCAGQCRAYLRHMHSVPHCTPCTYCTHGIHCCHTITRHLVSLTIFWQKGQWVLRCCTSHKNLQILQNSTLQVPCTKAALCLGHQLFNTLAYQEAALHFNYTLPMLFVLYSLHFLHIIVLCTS